MPPTNPPSGQKLPAVGENTKTQRSSSIGEPQRKSTKPVRIWRPVIDDMLAWVKSVLYVQFIDPGDCVCEIFCGTGPELKRWIKCPIGYYLGIDQSESNIREAQSRFEKQGLRPPTFPIEYLQADPLKSCSLRGIRAPATTEGGGSHLFESVCSHNALTVAFRDEQSLMSLLDNVAQALKPGGLFYGTMPDPSGIWYRAQKSGKSPPAFKGEGYEVVFDKHNDNFNFFGTSYQLRLLGEDNSTKPDAGARKERYFMVHIPTLRAAASKVGLEMVDMPNMIDFYEDYGYMFNSQLKNMYPRLDRHGKVPVNHMALIGLHMIFVFRYKPTTVLEPIRAPDVGALEEVKEDGEMLNMEGESQKADHRNGVESTFSNMDHADLDVVAKRKFDEVA